MASPDDSRFEVDVEVNWREMSDTEIMKRLAERARYQIEVNDETSVGAFIAKLVACRNFTRESCANQAGVSVSFLNRLVVNRFPVTRRGRQDAFGDERYKKLAQFLSLDVQGFCTLLSKAQECLNVRRKSPKIPVEALFLREARQQIEKLLCIQLDPEDEVGIESIIRECIDALRNARRNIGFRRK